MVGGNEIESSRIYCISTISFVASKQFVNTTNRLSKYQFLLKNPRDPLYESDQHDFNSNIFEFHETYWKDRASSTTVEEVSKQSAKRRMIFIRSRPFTLIKSVLRQKSSSVWCLFWLRKRNLPWQAALNSCRTLLLLQSQICYYSQ